MDSPVETVVGTRVKQELENGVLRLKLAAPPANALSIAMMAELSDALVAAAESAEVRVIILAAEGKVFCAGHDLKEMTAHRSDEDGGRDFFSKTMGYCATLMQQIIRHPKIIIAEVHALATAAGCQLVASCDLAVAADNAGFCTPGVNIGLFCSTPMVALSRNVGRKHAMEMLVTGDTVSAQDALRIGLVNRVVPLDKLRAEASALAVRIASKSARTLKTGKEAFYLQAEMGLAEAYDYTAGIMVENMLYDDACEGISAFIEKRHPHWKDS
ncbi:enoyl-CoA hydratase [Limoniibacter endophyticus]|uniref:Enoyl-CoA hydratase domain-containing protein 3, mitochondrial n=1 Tax=Limoniibacter endophyticus TaxID=1565040 RepID=A0A8J3GIQ7_9HYPH|nr:enoyl-CoA hydratase [Limoniibacter endophyticus]GHC79094.1 enoyl-CoA hydratase [Limoniibacter endophyticus]